jgi:hypothetical protein
MQKLRLQGPERAVMWFVSFYMLCGTKKKPSFPLLTFNQK